MEAVNTLVIEFQVFTGMHGKYKIHTKLSHGGFGTVYKAKVLDYDNQEILKIGDQIVIKT
jgi:serine/threonine protein kinase